jgi:hypothetical protein
MGDGSTAHPYPEEISDKSPRFNVPDRMQIVEFLEWRARFLSNNRF